MLCSVCVDECVNRKQSLVMKTCIWCRHWRRWVAFTCRNTISKRLANDSTELWRFARAKFVFFLFSFFFFFRKIVLKFFIILIFTMIGWRTSSENSSSGLRIRLFLFRQTWRFGRWRRVVEWQSGRMVQTCARHLRTSKCFVFRVDSYWSTLFYQVYGDQHPDVARVKNRLGTLYIERTQFSRAEQYFKDALSIRIATLGFVFFIYFFVLI